MILAHHHPLLDMFSSAADIALTFWFLYHINWTHGGWR